MKFLFSRKTFETIFQQLIADMREEHAEALQAGQVRKAQWIVVCGHLNIGLTLIAHLKVSLVKKIVAVWKISP